MQRCNAKTRSGGQCKRRPVAGKTRCRAHGGASTGPTGGPGLYAAVTDEERQAVRAAADNLDGELIVARVLLERALNLWDRYAEGTDLPLEERVDTTDVKGGSVTLRQRRPDLFAVADRALGRIARLVEVRARVEEVQRLAAEVEALRHTLEEEHE